MTLELCDTKTALLRWPQTDEEDAKHCRYLAEGLTKHELVDQLMDWCTDTKSALQHRRVDELRSFYEKEVAPRLTNDEWNAIQSQQKAKEDDRERKRPKRKPPTTRLADDKLVTFVSQHLGEVFSCRHPHWAADLLQIVGYSKQWKKVLLRQVQPVCQGESWTLDQTLLPKPICNETKHTHTAFVKEADEDGRDLIYSLNLGRDCFSLEPPGTVLSGSWSSRVY